jgi:hypothetical protein
MEIEICRGRILFVYFLEVASVCKRERVTKSLGFCAELTVVAQQKLHLLVFVQVESRDQVSFCAFHGVEMLGVAGAAVHDVPVVLVADAD